MDIYASFLENENVCTSKPSTKALRLSSQVGAASPRLRFIVPTHPLPVCQRPHHASG